MTSQSQRPFTNSKLECVMDVYWCIPNRELGHVGAAAFTFHSAMIGCHDNTAKFREVDLQPYTLYPNYGVVGGLLWSKNVTDERDVLPQVIFGAIDTRYQFLSNGRHCLEGHYTVNPAKNGLFFGYEGLDDPIQIKEKLSHLLDTFQDRF